MDWGYDRRLSSVIPPKGGIQTHLSGRMQDCLRQPEPEAP